MGVDRPPRNTREEVRAMVLFGLLGALFFLVMIAKELGGILR